VCGPTPSFVWSSISSRQRFTLMRLCLAKSNRRAARRFSRRTGTSTRAYDELERIIAQKTRGTTEPRADETVVTLGWFTRNRFFPLREGSTWKETTAETHKSAIEHDILKPLGNWPLKQIDKVMLQTHLNDLATRMSEGRVKHARFY
jgi:hypothetical protein